MMKIKARIGRDTDLWAVNLAGVLLGVHWFGWWFLLPALMVSFSLKFEEKEYVRTWKDKL